MLENDLKKINLKKFNYKKIIDIVIIILLLITCIKRGGFYKEDVLAINLVITVIGIVYLCITSIISKRNVISIVSIFTFLLGVSYFLPILLENNADMSDSIFEMIRYFNLYIIYKIVSESDNKIIYENGIIIVTLLECIIGIDGIGSRYLTNILKYFQTGYLSKDFTRMSGTIQYANVFAIICAISLLMLIFKLNKEKRKFKFLYCSCFFFIFSSLLLTESRAVIAIFIVFLVYYIISSYIKNEKNIKECIWLIFFNTVYSVIYTATVYNFAMYNSKIYILTICALLLNLLINFIVCKSYIKATQFLNIKKFAILLIALVIAYLIFAINISAPLTVIADINKREITRNIYNVKKNEKNNITFKVDENEINTRYTIKFVQVLNNLDVKEIKEVGYFSSSTGNFDFSFELCEDVKYIKIYIKCEMGSITLRNMELNGNSIKLNYLLIPSSIIYKFQDALNGTTSITDRIEFYKDALAIITDSSKNFLFGLGGEGFKNTYELYQNEKYISSEVHNSFLQIFVESGITGFLCVSIIVIYTLIKNKDKEKNLLLLIFVIHSFIDLELSYFSMIFLFGILLGLCVKREKFKINVSSFLQIPSILVLVIVAILLFKANIAYRIKVDTTSNDIAKEAIVIKNLEERVMLDKYDIDYRIELNDEYEKYLKILLAEYLANNDKILEEEIKNIITNIKINADTMMKNSKYNKYVIINVTNIYFNNLYYFVKLYYPENNELGYEEYTNYILSNIEELKKHKYNEVAISEVENLCNDYYKELKEKNKSINSLRLQEFMDMLN